MVIDNIFISGSGSLVPILFYYDVVRKILAIIASLNFGLKSLERSAFGKVNRGLEQA
jgi:hypothetical protein